MKVWKHNVPDIYATNIFFCEDITCAINSRELSRKLVRCKSSNLWSYGLDVQNPRDNTGTLVIQFKSSTGGAGDVYIYYDVPVKIYRQLITSPSKGHFFWKNIRNKYSYDKLGAAGWHGKLPNAVR